VRQELLLRNLKKCRENKENEKKHAEENGNKTKTNAANVVCR
jgi:hypothetical protein